jgi:hypothetical protein
MSSRLEQAMKRLDDAVGRLEAMPKAESAPAPSDPAVKTEIINEIAEIRGLVDQAMDALNASAKGPTE